MELRWTENNFSTFSWRISPGSGILKELWCVCMIASEILPIFLVMTKRQVSFHKLVICWMHRREHTSESSYIQTPTLHTTDAA